MIMQSEQCPRLLSVRVNSDNTDAFTPPQIYYGPERHPERREQHGHRTHTSVELLAMFNIRILLTLF